MTDDTVYATQGRRGAKIGRLAVTIGSTLLIWPELLGWSVLARLLVARCSLETAVQILDGLPLRPARAVHAVPLPSDRTVRLAGACLGRSLARSQYLRRRGVSHALVIGATGGIEAFQAHAWVAPYEAAPDGFVELRRIER